MPTPAHRPSADDRRLGLRRRCGHPGRPEDHARPRGARDERADRRHRAELPRRAGHLAAAVGGGRAQFRSVVDDIGVDAVKIGMLGTRRDGRMRRRAAGRAGRRRAGRGRPGLCQQARRPADRRRRRSASLRTLLLPRATVVTPNLGEAALLAGVARGDAARSSWPAAAGVRAAVGAGQGRARRRAIRSTISRVRATAPISLRRRARRQPAHPRHRLHARFGTGLPAGPGTTVPEATAAAKAYVTGAIAARLPARCGDRPHRSSLAASRPVPPRARVRPSLSLSPACDRARRDR